MSSEGIVTVSYKTYRDTYRNTYQISQYVSFVEKVYRYTPTTDTQDDKVVKCPIHKWKSNKKKNQFQGK